MSVKGATRGAKIRHKAYMLEYWGNPENKFLSRQDMHNQILGITANTFYNHFRPEEITIIEGEALELRKKASGRQRVVLYKALYDEAKTGNVKAIKEFLDRTEGKVLDKHEITGKDGKDLKPVINVTTTGNKCKTP